jgi:hypothetical protein
MRWSALPPQRTVCGLWSAVGWQLALCGLGFLILWVCRLPGLWDLARLVSLGLISAACLGLAWLPAAMMWLRPKENKLRRAQSTGGTVFKSKLWGSPAAQASLLVLGTAIVGLFIHGMPHLGNRMSPQSRAEASAGSAVAAESAEKSSPPLHLVLTAQSEDEMSQRLLAVRTILDKEKAQHRVDDYTLPGALWPDPWNRQKNLLDNLPSLVRARSTVLTSLKKRPTPASPEQVAFVEKVWDYWQDWAQRESIPLTPEDTTARWLLGESLIIRSPLAPESLRSPGTRCLAHGLIQLSQPAHLELVQALTSPGLHLMPAAPPLSQLEDGLHRGFSLLLATLLGLTLIAILGTVRGWRSLLLCLGSFILAVGATFGMMTWLHLSWDPWTLPALVLTLSGVAVFIQVTNDLEKNGSYVGMRGRLGRPILLSIIVTAGVMCLLTVLSHDGLRDFGAVAGLSLLFQGLSAFFVLPFVWDSWRSQGR